MVQDNAVQITAVVLQTLYFSSFFKAALSSIQKRGGVGRTFTAIYRAVCLRFRVTWQQAHGDSEDHMHFKIANKLKVIRCESFHHMMRANCCLSSMVVMNILSNTAQDEQRWMTVEATWLFLFVAFLMWLIKAFSRLIVPLSVDIWCGIFIIIAAFSCSRFITPLANLAAQTLVTVFFRMFISVLADRIVLNVLLNVLYSIHVLYRFKTESLSAQEVELGYSSTHFVQTEIGSLVLLFLFVASARFTIKRQVRLSIEATTSRVELTAANALLHCLCDAVVELDEMFQFTEHSPQLSTMLLRTGNEKTAPLKGTGLDELVVSDERERLVKQLNEGVHNNEENEQQRRAYVHSAAFHTRLHDSMGNLIPVEMIHVQYGGAEGELRHLVGIREFDDIAPIAPLLHNDIDIGPAVEDRPAQSTKKGKNKAHGTPRQSEPEELKSVSSASVVSMSSLGSSIVSKTSTGVPKLARSKFAPTRQQGKVQSLEKLMIRWNTNFSQQSCCKRHAALKDVLASAKLASLCNCETEYCPVGDLQCDQCGILCDAVDADDAKAACHVCGGMLAPPPLRIYDVEDEAALWFNPSLKITKTNNCLNSLGGDFAVGNYLGEYADGCGVHLGRKVQDLFNAMVSGDSDEIDSDLRTTTVVLRSKLGKGHIAIEADWILTIEFEDSMDQDDMSDLHSIEVKACLTNIKRTHHRRQMKNPTHQASLPKRSPRTYATQTLLATYLNQAAPQTQVLPKPLTLDARRDQVLTL